MFSELKRRQKAEKKAKEKELKSAAGAAVEPSAVKTEVNGEGAASTAVSEADLDPNVIQELYSDCS